MKNKKAQMEDLAKYLLWIIFIGIALLGTYFLFKFLTHLK
jgi:hypothetical protein